MHILFVHKNFPAQFGQIATYLARNDGCECTFLSEREVADTPEIRQVRFTPSGGAREETHYCSRTFENQTWRSYAAYDAMRRRPELRPDLIVSHSGFVSSLFLRELYPDVPHISYFEFFYHPHQSEMDFRSDLPLPDSDDYLRARLRNAQLLIDLNHCDAGYAPTDFQRSRLPSEYSTKVQTIFDGIDTDFWAPNPTRPRPTMTFGDVKIPPHHRLLTYVSRGFESMRGFDIFLQVADAVCRQRSDVSVVIVGEDRVAYGGDNRFTNGLTFKEWTIQQHQPNLDRIHFVGRLPPSQLTQLLALSDLHLYLTVPFVLSWSLMNALSCGCTVLASDTAPVREVIREGENGFLCDFFNVQGFTEQALAILEKPEAHRELGESARQRMLREYALPVCLEKMRRLYEEVRTGGPSARQGH